MKTKQKQILNSEILYLLKSPSYVTRNLKIKRKKTKILSYVTPDNAFITELE